MYRPNSSESIWYDYIGKCNDRELNRQRNSGFTTWAIAGVLGALTFNIIDSIQLLSTVAGIFILVGYCITVMLNTMAAGAIVLIGLYAHATPHVEIRLTSHIGQLSQRFVTIPLFSFVILLIGLNIVALITCHKYAIPRILFIIPACIYIGQMATAIYKSSMAIHKRKAVNEDLPELDTIPHLANKHIRTAMGYSFIIYGIVLLMISIHSGFHVIHNLGNDVTAIVKCSMEVVIWISLICILFIKMGGLMRKEFLLTLERRIILEDLSAAEIRSLYISEYIGESIRDWIAKTEEKSKILVGEFLTAIADADQFLAEHVHNIHIDDKQKEAGKAIIVRVDSAKKVFTEHMYKALECMTILVGEKAFISETFLFEDFIAAWKAQLKEVEKAVANIYEKCKMYES